MKTTLRFLPSLLITIAVSFLAPMVLCGLLLSLCVPLGILPGVTVALMTEAFLDVLKIFGNGCIMEGMFIIAIACGFVGGMFETFHFYYYQRRMNTASIPLN